MHYMADTTRGYSTMGGVTVIDHPLVQHKLTIMRKKDTSTAGFRRLLREISTLLCYEIDRADRQQHRNDPKGSSDALEYR